MKAFMGPTRVLAGIVVAMGEWQWTSGSGQVAGDKHSGFS